MTAERLLLSQPGVRSAEVSLASERGWISYDPIEANLRKVVQSIDRLGFSARLVGGVEVAGSKEERPYSLLQLIASVAFGMQVMMLSLVHLYPAYAAGGFDTPSIRSVQYLVWFLTTPVLFYGGLTFLRGAVRAALARTATMDTLVSLGTLSAYAYSVWFTLNGGREVYFDSVVMITVFVGFGRYIETLGGDQARKGIRSLLHLQPESALLQHGSEWLKAPALELAVGDVIMVRGGERVPADSEIAEGGAAFDEALLTGEAVPIAKSVGDSIYSGSMALDGMVICRVTQKMDDTRLARIAELVERTLETKPPIQRLADQVSAWFAWSVIALALLVFFSWWIFDHNFARGLVSAVAVLVVACPCALGLATPFAISMALGRSAEKGILVRNSAALETAAKVTRLAFDKTGTLTMGHMSVSEARPNSTSGLSAPELLSIAAAVENFSGHPLAAAISAAVPASERRQAMEFSAVSGKGVTGLVPSAGIGRILIGTVEHIDATPPAELTEHADRLADGGHSIVWIGKDGRVLGYIALEDELNPTAATAIAALSQVGIESVILSGDAERTVRSVAGALALRTHEASLTPESKADRIRSWQTKGIDVGMVGDGVNDSPALAAADLSVAMGAGSDVAGQTADIILVKHDLNLVPWFVAQSQKTRTVIRQNLFWAFSYNLVMVPLAATDLISPMLAAGAMAVSSLIVVGNSLR